MADKSIPKTAAGVGAFARWRLHGSLVPVAFAIAASLLLVAESHLTRSWYPPAWPDESMFADPAIHFLQSGRFGSFTQRHALPGLDRYWYIQPPGYPSLLVAAFTIGGISLNTVRVTSLLCALPILWMTLYAVRRMERRTWLPCAAAVTVAMDCAFLRSANLGRMDMAAIALATGSACMYLRYLERPRAWLAALAGLLGGLAVQFHALGGFALATAVVHLLLSGPRKAVASGALWLLLAGAAVALAPWAVYALQDPQIFWIQFSIQFARKGSYVGESSLLVAAWRTFDQYGGTAPKLVMLAVSLAAFAGMAWRTMKARPRSALLFWLFLTAIVCAGAVFGREMWYVAYMVVPLHVCAWSAIAQVAQQGPERRRLAAGLGIVFTAAVLSTFPFAIAQWMEHGPSRPIAERIEQVLPENARVMLLCIPDPYFDLRASPKAFRLSAFVPPQVPTRLWPQYAASVDQVEFFVISQGDELLWKGTLYEPRMMRKGQPVYVFAVRGRTYMVIDARPEPERERRPMTPPHSTLDAPSER